MGRPNKLRRHATGQWCTTIAGRTHYFGTNFREAERKFYAIMAQRTSGRPVTRCDQAIEQWLATQPDSQHTAIKLYTAWSAGLRLARIESDHLELFCEFLKRKGHTHGGKKKRKYGWQSLRRFVGAARSFLQWCERHKLIDSAPKMPRIKREARQPKDVPIADIEALLASLRPNAYRITRFMAETGARPGEACRLTWNEVDLENRVCMILDHKAAGITGQPRMIYLTDAAVEVLQDCPRTHDHVFISSRGAPYTVMGLRAVLIRRKINPYQLRHTFAQIRSEHVPLDLLARMLGHTDVRTVNWYREIRHVRLRELASRLDALTSVQSPQDQPSSAPSTKRASKKRRSKKGTRAAKSR